MQISSLFSDFPDSRGTHGRRYSVESLLGLILVGLLCGRNSLASIWRLAQGFTAEQRLALGFDKWRLPSHPILTTLLQQIDADALEKHLSHIVLSGETPRESLREVAIDGKTLRGSRVGEGRAMHVLSAFCSAISGVLHQEKMAEDENEITAALRVLARLELKNTLITGDAIFAQKAICQTIRQQEGHYLFTLKGNQPAVQRAIGQSLDTAEKKTAPGRKRGAESRQNRDA